jgi:hypothetical protein
MPFRGPSPSRRGHSHAYHALRCGGGRCPVEPGARVGRLLHCAALSAYPLLLYADGVTISFAPDPQNDIERKYGPDADTRIPQVMKLSCHYDAKGYPKIAWPIDQKTICEKTTITIGGQSCAIESIGAATLNDLPDIERVVRMEDDGSSGLASAPWLLGWRIKKH